MSTPVALWEHVHKQYGGRFRGVEALRDFSLDVPAGVTWGLLGANGSGKTTAVQILLDLIRPDTGRVELFGQNVRRTAGRARVGFLPESFESFPRARVRTVLTMFARLKSTATSETASSVEEGLADFGLEKVQNRRFHALSRGLKQRVGLAQAFMGDPQLLILDEPTGGLDPDTQQRLYHRVDRRNQAGQSTLIITHRLEEARRMCDGVSLMEEGRLADSGETQRILSENRPNP